ncbi:hypothetical protein [Effusibacillus consociatus]|uniref:ImmA/IrrE family metallo-endopeptidase n=1 Tax=Effusibacillus consociatus TaxID=1117041 RepID=A0ABV9PYX1_9BACL
MVEAAKALIQQYGTNDPFKIANLREMKVVFQPMPEGIRGIYVTLEQQEIYVNSNLSSEWQRAIAAIEIGYSIWRERKQKYPLGEVCVFYENGPMSLEPLSFAAHLLLCGTRFDKGETKEHLSIRTGVPLELVQLLTW